MAEQAFRWPACIVTQASDLGGVIHFVPDDATVVEGDDGVLYMGWQALKGYEPGVVYRAAELVHLVKLKPSLEGLRTIHAVKRIFGARVTGATIRPKRLWTEEEVADAWAGWSLAERERYLASRLRALEILGLEEGEASYNERALAASWAAERVKGKEVEG